MRGKQCHKSGSSDLPGEKDGGIEGEKSSESDASDSESEDTNSDSKDTTQGQKQQPDDLADVFDSVSFVPYSQRAQKETSDDRNGDEKAGQDATNNTTEVEEHNEDGNIDENGGTKRPENEKRDDIAVIKDTTTLSIITPNVNQLNDVRQEAGLYLEDITDKCTIEGINKAMNDIKENPCTATTDDVLNLLEIISVLQNTIKDQENELESGTKKLKSFTKFWSARRKLKLPCDKCVEMVLAGREFSINDVTTWNTRTKSGLCDAHKSNAKSGVLLGGVEALMNEISNKNSEMKALNTKVRRLEAKITSLGGSDERVKELEAKIEELKKEKRELLQENSEQSKRQKVDARKSESVSKEVEDSIKRLESSVMLIQRQQEEMQHNTTRNAHQHQERQKYQQQQQHQEQQQQQEYPIYQRVATPMLSFAGNQPALIQQQHVMGPVPGQAALCQHAHCPGQPHTVLMNQGQGNISGCQVLSSGGNMGMFANSTNMAVSHQPHQPNIVSPTQNVVSMGSFM